MERSETLMDIIEREFGKDIHTFVFERRASRGREYTTDRFLVLHFQNSETA